MIAYLKGQLLKKTLRSCIVLVSGVGYQVHLSVSDLAQLGATGSETSLHIHTHVKDDAIELFGFLSQDSLELFELLIQTNGVGPKSALTILSGVSTEQLIAYVQQGDHKALTRIPGIGPKTAQRIVLELHDKINKLGTLDFASPIANDVRAMQDLRAAMLSLGYKAPQIEKAVKSVEHLAKAGHNVESLLKEALRGLA